MTIRAIIFDMDGTLTESYINWPDLRSKINCPPEKNHHRTHRQFTRKTTQTGQ